VPSSDEVDYSQFRRSKFASGVAPDRIMNSIWVEFRLVGFSQLINKLPDTCILGHLVTYADPLAWSDQFPRPVSIGTKQAPTFHAMLQSLWMSHAIMTIIIDAAAASGMRIAGIVASNAQPSSMSNPRSSNVYVSYVFYFGLLPHRSPNSKISDLSQ
jgi:hypothetical protein